MASFSTGATTMSHHRTFSSSTNSSSSSSLSHFAAAKDSLRSCRPKQHHYQQQQQPSRNTSHNNMHRPAHGYAAEDYAVLSNQGNLLLNGGSNFGGGIKNSTGSINTSSNHNLQKRLQSPEMSPLKPKRSLPYITKSIIVDNLWDSKSNNNITQNHTSSNSNQSWQREIVSNMYIERDYNNHLDKTNLKMTSGNMGKAGSDSGASSAVISPTASNSSGQLREIREPTHRGLYKFVARHLDEIEIDIGDPVFVEREDEDLWCFGINLRTSAKGVFPSMVITDVLYCDLLSVAERGSRSRNSILAGKDEKSLSLMPAAPVKAAAAAPAISAVRKERFLMAFMGSVEVFARKGNQVIREAIQRIEASSAPSAASASSSHSRSSKSPPNERNKANAASCSSSIGGKTKASHDNHPKGLPSNLNSAGRPPLKCVLEICDLGVRLCDMKQEASRAGAAASEDFFFCLKDVTFCGVSQEKDHFAFITKHPQKQDRLACHVFKGQEKSPPNVAESIGHAFERYHQRFVEATAKSSSTVVA